MNAKHFTSMLLVISLTTALQAQDTHHSFFEGPTKLELNYKIGLTYGHPRPLTIYPETETVRELEVDVVKGHGVVSAFAGQAAAGSNLSTKNSNWELGVLLGWNWHYGHSVFELKGGVFSVDGKYMTNALHSEPNTEIEYRCMGELIDCSYRYELKDEMFVGLSVPLTLTQYFVNTGVNLSMGMTLFH